MITVSHSSTCATGLRVMTSENIQMPSSARPGADLLQHALEGLVEAQHVDGEPGVALAEPRHGAKGEDDDGGKDDAHARRMIELADDAPQHAHTTAIETTNTISWLYGDAGEGERHHEGAEGDAAAEDAPVDRPPLDWSRGGQAGRR